MNEALDKMEKMLQAAMNGVEEIVPKHTKRTSEEETTFVRLEKKKTEDKTEEKKKDKESQEMSEDEESDNEPSDEADYKQQQQQQPQHHEGPEEGPHWGYQGPWYPPYSSGGNYRRGSYGRPWGHSKYYGGYQRPYYDRPRHYGWN